MPRRDVYDGSGSWRPAGTGLTETIIRALAVDPTTPTTLWAASHRVHAATWGGSVFEKTNGGGACSAINAGLKAPYVQALAIDPLTPSTVYAGTCGGGVFALDQLPIKVYLPVMMRGW